MAEDGSESDEFLQDEFYNYYDFWSSPLIAAAVPITIISIVVIVVAAVGNILTILSFSKDKGLRTVYNYYIVNLAIVDVTFAILIMPVSLASILDNYTWRFGRVFCRIYNVIDYTCCVEAVLCMVAISRDRVMLLKHGPMYSSIETPRKARGIILLTWFLAFLLYGPAIVFWEFIFGAALLPERYCDVDFYDNFVYMLTTAMLEFLVPMVSLCTLNFYIYWLIRKRNRVGVQVRTTKYKQKRDSTINEDTNHESKVEHENQSGTKMRNASTVFTVSTNNHMLSSSTQKQNNQNVSKHASSNARDIKAAKNLALLVVVFLLSWAPLTTYAILLTLCESCYNDPAYETLAWFMWGKAALNPFLYAYSSKKFRENFKFFLTRPCLKLSNR